MLFRIDPSVQEPLHRQIVDQMRHQVATGKLAPGDRLPPVRSLAEDLGVNVNTAAKAYAELERSGVLSPPRAGDLRGGRRLGRLVDFREDRLRDLLGRAVVEALSLGYSLEQIEGALALQWARWRELRSAGPTRHRQGRGPRPMPAGSPDRRQPRPRPGPADWPAAARPPRAVA